mmetsp:Transcript_38511/g.90932  ORF Transcript_38511/g.90932 Transcript_38511/m.90932 type:complete len:344 (-) Transcript_38511:377-1408(-)
MVDEGQRDYEVHQLQQMVVVSDFPPQEPQPLAHFVDFEDLDDARHSQNAQGPRQQEPRRLVAETQHFKVHDQPLNRDPSHEIHKHPRPRVPYQDLVWLRDRSSVLVEPPFTLLQNLLAKEEAAEEEVDDKKEVDARVEPLHRREAELARGVGRVVRKHPASRVAVLVMGPAVFAEGHHEEADGGDVEDQHHVDHRPHVDEVRVRVQALVAVQNSQEAKALVVAIQLVQRFHQPRHNHLVGCLVTSFARNLLQELVLGHAEAQRLPALLLRLLLDEIPLDRRLPRLPLVHLHTGGLRLAQKLLLHLHLLLLLLGVLLQQALELLAHLVVVERELCKLLRRLVAR